MKSRDSEDIASNKHIAGVPFFAPFDGSSVACTNRVCNKGTIDSLLEISIDFKKGKENIPKFILAILNDGEVSGILGKN